MSDRHDLHRIEFYYRTTTVSSVGEKTTGATSPNVGEVYSTSMK